jgi:tartrate-resistant acid phosphatase type 5
MIGDWSDDRHLDSQSSVARAMAAYTRQHHLKHDALFLLGDNFYGEFPGGVLPARSHPQRRENAAIVAEPKAARKSISVP